VQVPAWLGSVISAWQHFVLCVLTFRLGRSHLRSAITGQLTYKDHIWRPQLCCQRSSCLEQSTGWIALTEHSLNAFMKHLKTFFVSTTRPYMYMLSKWRYINVTNNNNDSNKHWIKLCQICNLSPAVQIIDKIEKKYLTAQNRIPTKYDVLLSINSPPEPLTRAAHENCTENKQLPEWSPIYSLFALPN